MKQTITVLIIVLTVSYSYGQSNKSIEEQPSIEVNLADSIVIDESKITVADFSRDSYIHTEANYTDANGKGIIIQNSYPRGGGLIYTPSKMQQYGHAVFWTRVVNRSEQVLQLDIHFPADSFQVYPSPDAHFKLLVPPDTMTLDKVTAFSFGFDEVGTFVESNFHKPSQLQRTIAPNNETIFYVVLLSHVPTPNPGISRTGLFLKGQNLFYRLTSSSGVKLMPCGQIDFKE